MPRYLGDVFSCIVVVCGVGWGISLAMVDFTLVRMVLNEEGIS